jgi:hypothetical protein
LLRSVLAAGFIWSREGVDARHAFLVHHGDWGESAAEAVPFFVFGFGEFLPMSASLTGWE